MKKTTLGNETTNITTGDQNHIERQETTSKPWRINNTTLCKHPEGSEEYYDQQEKQWMAQNKATMFIKGKYKIYCLSTVVGNITAKIMERDVWHELSIAGELEEKL